MDQAVTGIICLLTIIAGIVLSIYTKHEEKKQELLRKIVERQEYQD